MRFFLNSRPKFLVLHLKRFDNALKKNTSRVSFPATLIKEALPAEYNEPDLLSSESDYSDYSLMSAVHHVGDSPGSGHYTADALRPAGDVEDDDALDTRKTTERVWFNFNDSTTAHQETRLIREDPVRQQTVSMMLYSRGADSNNK